MSYTSQRPLFVSFVGGSSGLWRIERMYPVVGEGLPVADRLDVRESFTLSPVQDGLWTLRGVTSNARYIIREEADELTRRQEGLMRPTATCAALIPIRKTEHGGLWRRTNGVAFLRKALTTPKLDWNICRPSPGDCIMSRELGEPFDFLTWFEYAPEHQSAFEELVKRLRETEEWQYVDREIDLRLRR
jgi:hypothetical protein